MEKCCQLVAGDMTDCCISSSRRTCILELANKLNRIVWAILTKAEPSIYGRKEPLPKLILHRKTHFRVSGDPAVDRPRVN